ncbi:hypothetical protein PUN28_001548 [Cardiocondyla obscurior]|uniref:ATP synthase F0 subunit 8 n=1 Tax=Cardiocondyla obscurior TaxID=286306 RepID=A0AAW2H5I0_9HYME
MRYLKLLSFYFFFFFFFTLSDILLLHLYVIHYQNNRIRSLNVNW